VGQENLPLPKFALQDQAFATALVKARGAKTKVQIRNALAQLGHCEEYAEPTLGFRENNRLFRANFAWHFRAWAQYVLERTRAQLATRYPIHAEFEPLKSKGRKSETALPQSDYPPPNYLP